MTKKFIRSLTMLMLVLAFVMLDAQGAKAATSIGGCTITLSKTSYEYTGAACKPTVTVKYGRKTLVNGTDYVLAYANNVNPGTAAVTITGKGNYSGSVKKTYTVKNALTVTLAKTSYVYTKTAIKPVITVSLGNTKLSSTYYSVTYYNNIKAGKATMVVKGKGKYAGKNAYMNFTITAKPMANTTVTLSSTSCVYSGAALKPTVTAKDGTTVLKNGTDYTVTYANNVNVGTASVTVTGKGNYKWSVKKTFTVGAKPMANTTITLARTSYVYSGVANKPAVTVKDGTKTLKLGTDYTVAYANNVNAGTATVSVVGRGNYKWTVKKTFTVGAKPMADTTVTLENTRYEYSGAAITPTVTVKDGTKTLKEGVDYTVSYSNNNAAGTGIVSVVGKGNYKWTVKRDFEIVEEYRGNLGDVSRYIGDAFGFSWDDSQNELLGLSEVDHSKVVWESDDSTIATVEPYPTSWGGGESAPEVLVTFVGDGETMVRAKYNGKEQVLKVNSFGIDDNYMSVSQSSKNNYLTDYDDEGSALYFGSTANSVIGQYSVGGAEGTKFNNPSGFTTYKKDGVLYVIISDAWNNRVLIYANDADDANIFNTIADEWGALVDPTLVLGQKNTDSSEPGYGMDQLNWAMDCEVDSKGRLYVADTNNHRIQVWDSLVDIVANGENGVEADHTIGWITPDHSRALNHLNWVWAVEIVNVDGQEKMIATSTGNAQVVVWNTLPESWVEYQDEDSEYTTPDYYPNVIMQYEWGCTPRTITWTGSQLLIGDESIIGYSNEYGREGGVRVFNQFPTAEYIDSLSNKDFERKIFTGDNAYYSQIVSSAVTNGANFEDYDALGDYGEGIMIDGKLYFACSMALNIFDDGVIDENDKPDKKVEKTLVNSGIGDMAGLEGFELIATGGLQEMIYDEVEDTLYLASHMGNGIYVFQSFSESMKNLTQPLSEQGSNIYSCPFPDYRIGINDYDAENKTNSANIQQIHSPIPATDGEHLVVLDDFDQQLRVYKRIPTSSGAYPDYSYNLPYEAGDIDLYTDENGVTTMMLTARTQNILYIWHDYKFEEEMPDTVIAKGIGGEFAPMETWGSIEYDGTYTYLGVGKENGCTKFMVFRGIPTKASKPIAYLDGDYYSVVASVTSNGDKVAVIADRTTILIASISQFEDADEDEPVILTREDMEAVTQVNYGNVIDENGSNDPDGNGISCKAQNYNIVVYGDKVYHIRNIFDMPRDIVFTEDGKFIVADSGANEVIVWESVESAIRGDAPICILGRSDKETDFDELTGIYNYHEATPGTYSNGFFMPTYLAYDGTNLWVGEFKFSNRLLRFNLKGNE